MPARGDMALDEQGIGAGDGDPEAPAEPSPMAPVAAGERIELIDILRGAALFGILAANARALGAPWTLYGEPELLFPGFADRFVQGLVDVFVSTKFVTLFSFLFGLGFAVQMTRAEERGARVRSFYPRRLLILLGIGIVHGTLLFWGDILTAYALIGFILLLFRKRQPKTVLRWAIGIPLVLTILVSIAFVVFQFIELPRENPGETLAAARLIATAFREEDFFGVVAHNLLSWISFVPRNLTVLMLLPAFLFGLWVWRQGIPQDPAPHMPVIRRVFRVAMPLGLVLNGIAVAEHIARGGLRPVRPDALLVVATLCRIHGASVLALGYATGLVLLAQRDHWRRRFAPAAAVGRMALTNYLLQSLVGVVFFTTTDLYGRMGPALLLIPTVLIYAGQVWFSNWWMQRFRYGPMEWLWRSLTYGRIGPLRRAPEPVVSAAA
jgi:uncharacterized protein